MSASDSMWIRGRFKPTDGVCDRVRALIETQEAAGRAHPGLWLPARDDHAVRIKPPARLREPTLAVRVYAAQQRDRSPRSSWYWRIAADEVQPRGYTYLAAESDETKLQRAERSFEYWKQLVRLALQTFVELDTPFVGLRWCGICGRSLVDDLEFAWTTSRRLIAALPTGGGKTEIASHIIGQHIADGERALVVVERKNLCHQWRERLWRHDFGSVGMIQADNTVATYSPCVIGTIQSLRARGVPENVSLIVIDESHIWHQAHVAVLENSTDARVLGLTATPLRAGLGLHFDRIVSGPTIAELIDQHYLVRPRYFAPRHQDIQKALADVGVLAREYKLNELSIAMRAKAIMGDIVSTWQARGEDRQTIAFCVDQQHARDLAAEFVAAGVCAEVILDDTADEDRAVLFQGFADRHVRVLCSVGVLGVGFDSPIASCAILARPTLSLSLHVQQGGRVLRPFDGKADALVLDHAGNTLRHGRLEDFVPPDSLSMIDEKTDKRGRHDAAQAWLCRACEAVNALGVDVCVECGQPRRRHSKATALDGDLHEWGSGTAARASMQHGICEFYRMATWYGRERGIRNPKGWAWYATQRRFRISPEQARKVVPWSWRELPPLPADPEASRWFRADWQRAKIAERYRETATK